MVVRRRLLVSRKSTDSRRLSDRRPGDRHSAVDERPSTRRPPQRLATELSPARTTSLGELTTWDTDDTDCTERTERIQPCLRHDDVFGGAETRYRTPKIIRLGRLRCVDPHGSFRQIRVIRVQPFGLPNGGALGRASGGSLGLVAPWPANKTGGSSPATITRCWIAFAPFAPFASTNPVSSGATPRD